MTDSPALPVPGIRVGSSAAEIRRAGRRDIVVLEAAPGAQCAAVFTRNAFCAAPVQVARAHIAAVPPRYLLINSGNANAGTGKRGHADALASCAMLAQVGGCRPEEVLPFSTGVIGEYLPMERMQAGMEAAHADLRAEGWAEAARAIMTTDTVPKLSSRRVALGTGEVVITGMAKGAGMIRPDMATMLAFIATDAAIEPDLLRKQLGGAVERSFNRISVDGDTSTNDACVLVASGAGARVAPGEEGERFQAALTELCGELAQAIVRDGEGATKFMVIEVGGGRDAAECLKVAYTIAHSPLVKTAFHASDANWGRILAAIGRAGVENLEIERVEVCLDDVCIVRGGERAAEYSELDGARVMGREQITVGVRLNRGSAKERIWTCDLSQEYVRINAEYRT